MPKFLLLLKGGDFQKYTPEEMQRILEDYMGFSARLAQAGKLLAGEELQENGRLISLKDGKPVVTDGPFAETKEVIGGFWLIEEPHMESATTTARDCPHIKYGGRVELREIIPHELPR